MKKMILINQCTKCPNLYLVDRYNSLCALKKSEQIEDTATIPTWCPLPNAPSTEKSDGKKLKYGRILF
jgi:hypothetical protein